MPAPTPTGHPKNQQISDLLNQGLTNTEISRRLHADRHTIARIRRTLGIPNTPQQPLTLEEKWASLTRPAEGSHLQWTGETPNPAGTPVMRYRGQSYTAARIAFRLGHGREPEGRAQPACGFPHCVAPGHILDAPGRRRNREALRLLLGMGPCPERCHRQHDQAVHGRLLPGGVAYCLACQQEIKAKARKRVAS